GLTILGIPYSVLLGIMTGVLETIPFVGPITAGAIACLVALGHPNPFGWSQIAYVAVVAIMYTVLRHAEDYLVIPAVIGRAVRLHPAIVIFALLSGGANARDEPVSVVEELTSAIVRDDQSLVDDGLDVDRRPSDGIADHQIDRDLGIVRLQAQVVLDDVLAAIAIRHVHHELAVEATCANERRVQNVGAVRRADDEHDR